MSGPSVLERCRMALAEIGIDPRLVRRQDGHIAVSSRLSLEQQWMLRCTTVLPPQRQVCLPCFSAWRSRGCEAPAPSEVCRADRPFQRVSCGATQ